jgi:probable O-glycosylation ligase (exosortase A-associated)
VRIEASNLSAQSAIGLAAACALASLWLFQPDPLVPLTASVFAALLVGAIARPFFVCLAFIAFSFFRLHEAYPFLYPFHLPLLLGAATVGGLCIHIFVARSIRPEWSAELKWLGLFFALATFGIALSVNREISWTFWTTVYWKIGLMTLALAWLARSSADFQAAARVFVLGGMLIAAVTIYNAYYGIGLVELTRVTVGRELDSLLGDPNDLALVLLFPLSFSVALALPANESLNRILGVAGIATIIPAIVFTQSRGGLLGVLAVLAAYGLRHVRSKATVVVLVAVGAVLLYSAMGISSRISGGGLQQGLDESAQERLLAWGAAINMALAKPLAGVGIANFAPSFFSYVEDFPGRDMSAHSTWFGVLGETGWPGLIVFIGMVGVCFRSILRSYVRLRASEAPAIMSATAFALISGLVGFCVAGSFLTQGFGWPIYIMVGLTAAVSRYSAWRRDLPSTN